MLRSDIREDPGRMMKLAEDGGVELWLDLATGRITEALAQREGNAAKSPGGETVSSNPGVLLERVRSSLAEWSLRTVTETPTSILYRVSQATGVCDVLVMTDDEAQLVGCYTVLPVRVPQERRSAVAEALVRANWDLRIGSFDLDFTDGEIRFRSAVDVEGGDLTTPMVHNLVGSSLHTVERFHQALMSVAFGEVDPAMAILEVGIESSGEDEPDDEG